MILLTKREVLDVPTLQTFESNKRESCVQNMIIMVMIMTPMLGKYYRYNYVFNQSVNDFKV